MIATAMLLENLLACPECGTEVWESETTRISASEHEWECRGCGLDAYFCFVPEAADR